VGKWVRVLPDRVFFVEIRCHGPLNAFTEKWVVNDVELVR